MIFGLIRLAVVGFVVLSVVYVSLLLYARSVRRERLEEEWSEQGGKGDRDAFVERGMAEYEQSLRRRLIWLVYVVPTLAALVLLYVINFM